MSGTVTYSQLGKNGRLANSLFQICATIAYALEHKKDFVFPEWRYSKYMKRPLPIGTVQVERIYNEPTYHYTPIPYFDGNADLSGCYAQSTRYFEKYINEILSYITIKDEYVAYIWGKYKKYLSKPCCSVHVRHGDYLTSPHLEWHGVLSENYYEEAVFRLYGKNYDEIIFLIFSDDLDWCRENFHFAKQLVVEGEEDIIDLFMGARCNDHIIANSSFSWWQSYLGNRSGRTVAPKKWFGEKTPLDTRDLYLKEWIKI